MIVRFFFFSFLVSSCNMNRNNPVDMADLLGDDYRLFQNTPAWELAKAVQDEDEKKITAIVAKEPLLINYQEPKYGSTLLNLTIINQQIKPFKVLLDKKVDLSIHNTYDGTSALIEACMFKRYDLDFAEILLQNGANVNDVEVGERRKGNSTRFTPLMAASKAGNLDLVNLLVKNGANLNYQNEYQQSALSEAAIIGNYNIVEFLLQKGVDYTLPITYNQEQKKTYYLVDELRFHTTDIGSNEHKLKLRIVSFLKSKGIDYNAVPIPEYVKQKAQNEYPGS